MNLNKTAELVINVLDSDSEENLYQLACRMRKLAEDEDEWFFWDCVKTHIDIERGKDRGFLH